MIAPKIRTLLDSVHRAVLPPHPRKPSFYLDYRKRMQVDASFAHTHRISDIIPFRCPLYVDVAYCFLRELERKDFSK